NVVDEVEQLGPCRVNVPGPLDLLVGEVAARVVGKLLAEHQNAVERRAQFVRHVGQKLGLVFGGQRQFRRLFFEFAAGLLDFLVLAFDFLVLFGKLAGFLGEFLVGVLKFGLAGLEFGGEFLGLFEQVLGAHVGLDGVEY